MRSLMESIPNFSEGRRPEVIEKIVSAARSVSEVRILDLHSDEDHNRSVLTLAGPAEALQESLFRTVEVATQLIDLRGHTGEHPRIGATDVVPFVPLGETSMTEAVEAARTLAQRVASELEIPVYFYEEAATRPDRRNLEHIRGKGFEDLRDNISADQERVPDLGPSAVHPTAGAIVIGARGPLIAYNVYLNTEDVKVAKEIARAIRHSSGGLRYVKAMGFEIPARRQTQVSMNLTNYRASSIYTVFELIKRMAEAHGVLVVESEVVGLLPMQALTDAARFYLRLHQFDLDQVLETKLMGD